MDSEKSIDIQKEKKEKGKGLIIYWKIVCFLPIFSPTFLLLTIKISIIFRI